MKIKILSFFVFVLFAFTLSFSSFALTPDEYGANYDTSHQENGCCTDDDTDDIHYNLGYEDGLLDGTLSQEEIDSYKAEAIDSYLKSIDFENLKLDIYNNGAEQAVDSFKGSKEYEDKLAEQYTDGVKAGYQGGYDNAYSDAEKKMYNKGWADGQADFRNGEEISTIKEACLDSGYERGYTDGFTDGAENTVDTSTIFAILYSIIGLVIALFVVNYVTNKYKKRK